MFLMPSASIFSQVSDLSLLGNLAESIPGSMEDTGTESQDQADDNDDDASRFNQETYFQDENY